MAMTLDSVMFAWSVEKGFTSIFSRMLLYRSADAKGSLKALETVVEDALGSWESKRPTGSCSNDSLEAGFEYTLALGTLNYLSLTYAVTTTVGRMYAIRCNHRDHDAERLLRVHDALTGIDGLDKSARALQDLAMIARLRDGDVASYERLPLS